MSATEYRTIVHTANGQRIESDWQDDPVGHDARVERLSASIDQATTLRVMSHNTATFFRVEHIAAITVQSRRNLATD